MRGGAVRSARLVHTQEVAGSNPAPAPKFFGVMLMGFLLGVMVGLVIGWNVLPQPTFVKNGIEQLVSYIRSKL